MPNNVIDKDIAAHQTGACDTRHQATFTKEEMCSVSFNLTVKITQSQH